MAGEVKIPIGLKTDNAVRDAKKLSDDVKRVMANIDMSKANSKTLSFIKNLTSAYNRMQKLVTETQKLAETKIPTEEYAYFTQQLEKAQSAMTKLQAKQEQLATDRATLEKRQSAIVLELEEAYAQKETAMHERNNAAVVEATRKIQSLEAEQEIVAKQIPRAEDAWRRVGGRISELQPVIRDLEGQLTQLVEQNEAFTSGTESQAYKDKAGALNVLNQAVNILLTRYSEMNGLSPDITQNIYNETRAIRQETDAVKELSNAEKARALANEHGVGNASGRVRRGPSRRPVYVSEDGSTHRLSRGPSVAGATFLKNGNAINATRELGNAEEETARKTEQLEQSVERSTGAVRSYGSVLSEVSKNILARIKSALNRLVSVFKSLSHHLHSSHKGHNNLMGNMKHSLSMILRYTLGIRSLFMLIRRLRSMVKEAFKVMAQEIPEVNEAVSMLGTSFKQLKAGFGTMLQPLFQQLAPLLNALIQRIVSLMNSVARFFATLTGQNYIYEATVANYDYAKSVEEAEKANENALASFDKLNVIAKDNSKNTLALNKETVTYKKVEIDPEDNWYTRLAKKIAEGWKKADLTDATHDIAEKLANMLDDIKWEDIRAKSTKFAHTLATGINGITLPDEETGKSHLAVSIGRTIAEALQTAIDTFDEFITTIKWDNLGKFIADAIESLKDKLRENDSWRKAGAAFGHLFQGLVKLSLELLVKNNVFKGLGTDLSDFVNELIKEGMKINPETNNTFIKDFGIALSTGFINLLKEIEAFLDGSSDELAEAVNQLFQGIDLFEIAKHLAIVFIKGLKTGLKLLLSAGLGALGITIDGSTAEYMAEALGIGLLGAKIAKLVGGITGSGGLLSAFGKKDKALQNQSKKLALEKVAVGVLSGVLGFLGLKALDSSKDIDTLTDSLGQTVLASESTKKELENVAEAGKTACQELEKDTSTTLANVQTQFEQTELKLNEVNTSSYDSVIAMTRQTISTIEQMWANANPTMPEVKTQTSNTTQTNLKTNPTKIVASGITSLFKGKQTTTSTQPEKVISGTPYAELTAQSIKATGELREKTIQANAGKFEEYLNQLTETDKALAAKSLSDTANLFGFSDLSDVWASDKWTDKVIANVKSDMDKDSLFKKSVSKNYLPSFEQGLANLLKWLPMAGSMGIGFPIPFLAQGAIIPANKPFMAVLGDQKQGTNVEAPLSTIEQAVANVLSRMQITNVFDVQGDPNRLFKVVQKRAEINYKQSGNSGLSFT